MTIHAAAPVTRYEYETPLTIGVIPDTHWCPSDKKGSLSVASALGKMYRKLNPDVLIHIGDANDMGSLSSYDKGKANIEGKRLSKELAFSRTCLDALTDGLGDWDGDMFLTLGNHEHRLFRYYDDNPELHGVLGNDPWGYEDYGFETLPFLHMLGINEVYFSHYIQNPTSAMGSPLGGMIDTALKNAGHSFVMGHVQTFKHGMIARANGRYDVGTIAGACYSSDHGYKGPQGNRHWRGALMMHNVDDGYYDLQSIGLKAILRDYK